MREISSLIYRLMLENEVRKGKKQKRGTTRFVGRSGCTTEIKPVTNTNRASYLDHSSDVGNVRVALRDGMVRFCLYSNIEH